MFHNTHPKEKRALQGWQEPKLLPQVGKGQSYQRSPLRALILEDDNPCSLGLGQQMLPGVTPFPIRKGRIGPGIAVSWQAGYPA